MGNMITTTAAAEYGKTALIINKRLTWKDAERMAETLSIMQGAIQWWIGDMLNYCEAEFGENYTQLFEAYDPKTLLAYKWVAAAIPPPRRRESLSWSHHQSVAGSTADVQDTLLERAECEGWCVSDLRQALRPPKQREPKMIRCPHCGMDFEVE